MNDFYKEILREEFIQRFDEERLKEECIKNNYAEELKEIEDDIEFTFLGCQDKDFEDYLKTPGIFSKLGRFRYLIRKYRSLKEYYFQRNPNNNDTRLRAFLWRMPDLEDFGEFGSITGPWVIDNGEVICDCPGKEIDPYDFCSYISEYIKDCCRLRVGLKKEQLNNTFEFIDRSTGKIMEYRVESLESDIDGSYAELIDENGQKVDISERLILKLY